MNLYVNARLETSQKQKCLEKSEIKQINLLVVSRSVRLAQPVFTCLKSATEVRDFTHYSGVVIVDFEQANNGWERSQTQGIT